MHQLPYIARPCIHHQHLHHIRRHIRHRLAVLFIKTRQKMLHKHRNILAPISQRRKKNIHHLQAIKEIIPESPFCNLRRQILIRRADNPNIYRHRLRTAQPLKLFLLKHTQQLRLRLDMHIANLVQKQRPPIRKLKLALSPCSRPGKRASLMPEQLALDQLCRQRRRIHRNKRPRLSSALLVNRPRDQFLSRTALPANQNRSICSGHLADQIINLLHCTATTNQQPKSRLLPNLVAKRLILPPQPHRLQYILHQTAQLIHIVGLAQIIVRPRLHRLHGNPLRPIRSNHNNRPRIPLIRQALHQRQPIHLRHLDIANQQIGIALRHSRQRRHPILCLDNLTPQHRQCPLQPIPRRRVIIHNQNFILHRPPREVGPQTPPHLHLPPQSPPPCAPHRASQSQAPTPCPKPLS